MKRTVIYALFFSTSIALHSQNTRIDSSEVIENMEPTENDMTQDYENTDSALDNETSEFVVEQKIIEPSNKQQEQSITDTNYLNKYCQFTRVSSNLLFFKPFSTKLVLRDFKVHYLLIDKKTKYAVAKDENTIYIIDLVDGEILYSYKFEALRKFLFSDNSDYFYFCDKNKVFEVDLNNFKKSMLFEIQPEYLSYNLNDECLFFNDEIMYYSLKDNKKSSSGYHYYNVYKYKKSMDSATRQYMKFDSLYLYQNKIIKSYNYFRGSVNDKLFKMKVLYCDDLLLSKLNSSETLLIVKELVEARSVIGVYKISGNQIQKYNFSLKRVNQNNQQETINYELYNFRNYSDIPFAFNGDKILFTNRVTQPYELYVTNLLQGDDMTEINSGPLNPVTFSNKNKSFVFFHYDNTHNRLYYQLQKNGEPSVLYAHEFNPVKDFVEGDLTSKSEKKLHEMDSILLRLYNTRILDSLNMPFETSDDRYYRMARLFKNQSMYLNYVKDSMVNQLFRDIQSYDKTVVVDNQSLFKLENYNSNTEKWILKFKGLSSNYGFSVLYDKSKNIAQSHFRNGFKKMNVSVLYYFDIMTRRFEPLKVSIVDSLNSLNHSYYITNKNIQLNKNICFVKPDNLINFNTGSLPLKPVELPMLQEILDGSVKRDDEVINYFINMGLPKRIFNISADQPNYSDAKTVEILDLHDNKWNYKFSPFPENRPYTQKVENYINTDFKFDFINEYVKINSYSGNNGSEKINILSISENGIAAQAKLENWDIDSNYSHFDCLFRVNFKEHSYFGRFEDYRLFFYSNGKIVNILDL